MPCLCEVLCVCGCPQSGVCRRAGGWNVWVFWRLALVVLTFVAFLLGAAPSAGRRWTALFLFTCTP